MASIGPLKSVSMDRVPLFWRFYIRRLKTKNHIQFSLSVVEDRINVQKHYYYIRLFYKHPLYSLISDDRAALHVCFHC